MNLNTNNQNLMSQDSRALNPRFVTGISDAESSFRIMIRKNNSLKVGWRVAAYFQISMYNKDRVLLELIQSFFGGVGNINQEHKDSIQYRISSVKDLAVVIDHFDKYPLITQKRADFSLVNTVVLFGITLFTYYLSQVFNGIWFDIDPVLLAAIPIKIYSNAEADKDKILKENKNKSGIYKWQNLTNGKCYIGSAVNLSDRLQFYYSNLSIENYLKKSKSHIYSALVKHGHCKFSLTILEYCDKEKCIEREDFYLSSLKHEYNILEKAGSSLGRKHSDETKKSMSHSHKGIDHSGRFQPGHKHTEETKTKISYALTGSIHPDEIKKRISEAKKGKPKIEGSGRPAQSIEVFDNKNNSTTIYDSIREAARALNIPSYKSISKYFTNNKQKPYKDRYTFKKVN